MELCLVYFSTAPGLTEEDLNAILQQSRENNAKQQISGVLLYVRGNIIQVLEGETQAVTALYERIRQDTRHASVDLILNRPIATRTFGAWSMGYKTLQTQQLDEIRALVDLENNAGVGSRPTDPILLRTLKLFYESNLYG